METQNQTVAGTEPAPLSEVQTKVVNDFQKTIDSMYAAGNREPASFSFAKSESEDGSTRPPSDGGEFINSLGQKCIALPIREIVVSAPGLSNDGPAISPSERARLAAESEVVAKHQSEVNALIDERQRTHQAVAKFKNLGTRVVDARLALDTIQKEVAAYEGVDLGATLYQERIEKGRILQAIASHHDVVTCVVVRAYGKDFLACAEAKYAAAKKEYDEHVKAHTPLLKSRGLI